MCNTEIFFFASVVGFPLYTEFFLYYYTMVLQRIRIIVGDAGTSAPRSLVRYKSHHISYFFFF